MLYTLKLNVHLHFSFYKYSAIWNKHFFPREVKGENMFSDSISSQDIQYFSQILQILTILVVSLEIFATKEIPTYIY